MQVNDTTLEVLSEDECRSLLASRDVGRLAVVLNGEPHVLPVNYACDGHRIAVRTDLGLKYFAARMRRVAFEIDEFDEEHREGWSVVAHGIGFDVTDTIDTESVVLRSMLVKPWPGGVKQYWIRIDIDLLTGRRIRRE